jgi:hypothetical protein
VIPLTFEQLRDPGTSNLFPRHLLRHGDTALVLFAAGFHGRQDAFWIAEAGMTATCVDLDKIRLHDMAAVYPPAWEFVVGDAFAFVEECAAEPHRWDVVTVDCWSNQFDACAAAAELWCSVARSAVVLGTGRGTVVVPPDGWEISEVRHRSTYDGGVFWTVLEPR